MASAEAKQRETKLLVEYAAKAAEQFVSLYYSAYDSRNRVGLIPTLYPPTSTVVWNGNPIQGNGGVSELMNSLPATKHDVQSMDAHPVGGSSSGEGLAAPSILITVSGVVTHHTPNSASALPPSNAPESSRKSSGRFDSSLPMDSLPRAFSQNFVLVNDPESKGEGGVVVSWDSSNSVSASNGGGGGGAKNGGGGGGSAAVLRDAAASTAPTITGRYFVQADQLRFVG